jgi:hypothetical protein
LESVDEYERLTTINETLMGKIKSLFRGKPKKETPVQMFSRMAADVEKKSPDEVAAKLDVQYGRQDANLPSIEDLTPPKAKRPFKKVGPVKFHPGKPKSISPRQDKLGESRFDPSENPNAEADQEFDRAANALRDAGIAYKALKRIGSMNREKDIFKIDRKDMRRAREVMQGFPNTQIKRA